jgi:hypothetical protein
MISLYFGIFGFILFLILLESPGMGNIWWRNGKFNPGGIIVFLTSPLYQSFLWYPSLWIHNWLIVVGTSVSIGLLISYFNLINS